MTGSAARRLPGGVPSAHLDTFARDNIPPQEMWPVMDYAALPALAYPDRVNCAVELLDGAITRGWGERVAFRSPTERVTYQD